MRRIFEKYQTKLGKVGGEKFDAFRPDYTAVDNDGDSIVLGRKMRAAGQANKFASSPVSGLNHFNCFGSRTGLAEGDYITPTESGSGTPTITIATISPLQAVSGFMTDQIGKITEDVGTDVFTNVRFAWLPIVFPGSDLTENMAGTMSVSVRKFACFKREGIRRGMRLIDQGDYDNQRWLIKDFITINNIMIINVTQDDQ